MNINSRLKSFISSKLYYSQPIYIPGYKYSPWKKWIIVSAILLFLVIPAVLFVGIRPNKIDTNVNTEQINTESQRPVDGTTLGGSTDAEPATSLETKPKLESNCDSNYSPCVPISTTDLDCDDIGFSVRVLGSDPHRFDGEGDGYGCESY